MRLNYAIYVKKGVQSTFINMFISLQTKEFMLKLLKGRKADTNVSKVLSSYCILQIYYFFTTRGKPSYC